MHYEEHTDISFATGHKMFEQEGGLFQYVEGCNNYISNKT